MGAGSDQRRRALVPRAALGLAAAGAHDASTAFFESYYRLRPVTATFTGIHDHDHRLPDWSPDGLAAAADEMRALRDVRSRRRARLTPSLRRCRRARSRRSPIAFLDVQLAEHESRHFQRGNPSLALGEAVFGVISLMTRPFAPTAERADAAVSRLTAVPAFLDGARRSTDGRRAGRWRVKALRECDGADRLLRDGLPRWIAIESSRDPLAQRLTKAAGHAGAAFDDVPPWLGSSQRH